MKYTLKAILVMALGCLTYSCLDLDPKDQIADGNYWQEASDFKLFANQFSRTACTMRLIRTSVRT